MKLFGYWRSSATYRIRILMALKELEYDYAPVNLLAGEQRDGRYLDANPQGLVPTLVTEDGASLTQSLAIAEYLEERFPDPSTLPDGISDRARARSIAAIIACEGQPFLNLRVQKYLKEEAEFSPDALTAWLNRWGGGAMRAVEELISPDALFCVGEAPSIADAFLIPQIYASKRFGVDLSDCPRALAIWERCNETPAFQSAHPDNQPDAPTAD